MEQVAESDATASGESGTNLAEQIDAYIGSSDANRNIRAVLVLLDGQPAVERYYDGNAEIASNVFSVTKSVTSTLIGIAIDEGYIESVDQTLNELLPSHADAMTPEVAATTLRSILTMTAGFPADPPPTEPFVFPTGDWVRLILSDGIEPPGEFAYSSAGSHLLSAIVAQATGQPTLDYAREKLFAPLGIDTEPAAEPVAIGTDLDIPSGPGFIWPRDPQGYHLGYAHLSITASDMAKVGQLFLDGGRWQGQQVVSADWVAEATREQADAAGEPDYGYQWWITMANGHAAFAAVGHGGQLIEVVPDLDLVVVFSTTVPKGPAPSLYFLSAVSDLIAPALE